MGVVETRKCFVKLPLEGLTADFGVFWADLTAICQLAACEIEIDGAAGEIRLIKVVEALPFTAFD